MHSPLLPPQDAVPDSKLLSRRAIIIALSLSALYLADTLLRASLKTFWYDELVTVVLCRLPSFHATWTAVMHGADFNPPLFYLLTRWGQQFTGEGLIASRLPGLVGFWMFGVCLFLFVRRRLGGLSGCIAAMFPVFTLAHNYAYEARPHGAVLAWFGLMLVCWQRARERRGMSLWTGALFLSSLAALLTHVYSVYLFVPFLAVEVLGFRKRWRLHLGATSALLLGLGCVAPLYLRMLHVYHSMTTAGGLRIHPYEVLQQYLVSVAGPSLVLLLIFLLLLAVERRQAVDTPVVDTPVMANPSAGLLPEELWLAAILACLPLIGAVGVKISHGPFFSRYFLAATAGYAILLAQAAASRRGRVFAARGLLAAMILLLTADTAIAAYCRWHHADLDQIEPASHFPFPPNPHLPLQRNAALLHNHDLQDVLVTEDHNFFYLYYYGSPALRRRLVFGAPDPNDFTLLSYQRQAYWGRLQDLRASSFAEFFATHRDFYVYSSINGTLNGACEDCLQQFLDAGYILRSVEQDSDNLLEHFSR